MRPTKEYEGFASVTKVLVVVGVLSSLFLFLCFNPPSAMTAAESISFRICFLLLTFQFIVMLPFVLLQTTTTSTALDDNDDDKDDDGSGYNGDKRRLT